MNPLTWALLMQLPTALFWYPLAWRLGLGRERGAPYDYFMAFAYLLAFAFQQAVQVLGGSTSHDPLAVTIQLTLIPASASAMAVSLAFCRRHAPAAFRLEGAPCRWTMPTREGVPARIGLRPPLGWVHRSTTRSPS